MRFLVFVLAMLALGVSAARAERSISFVAYDATPEHGAVILPVREGDVMGGAVSDVNEATDGALARAIADAGYTGAEGATLTLFGLQPYTRIDLIGLGDGALDRNAFETFGARAGKLVRDADTVSTRILWSGAEEAGAHIAFGARLGAYAFNVYKTTDVTPVGETLEIAVANADDAASAWSGDWRHLADAVTLGRDLATEPPNVLYPESFVERARAAFRGVDDVTIRVLGVREMERLGMGAHLGVGQGSVRPPRLLVIEYDGGQPGDAPIVFAGKGVTFDSGGLSLKSPTGMLRMKADMTGAAVVTSAALAIAKRGAPANVVAIAALAENMPDAGAQRPSDVVRTMSGRTVEIISTDAEGRLVLIDAVTYAQREYDPAVLIDVATLTGSVIRALSDEYAGLFTRHDALADDMIAAGAASGEELWRLPLHPNYYRQIHSPIADIKNSGAGNPGAGVGAAVIGTFVAEDVPWAHLDIAGRDHRDKGDDAPLEPVGYTAFGVRLLDQFVRGRTE